MRVLKIIIEDRKKLSCLLAVFIFILDRKIFWESFGYRPQNKRNLKFLKDFEVDIDDILGFVWKMSWGFEK